MRIAIPSEEGKICMHFGHCPEFIIAEVDTEHNRVLSMTPHTPPTHAPGVLPEWLSSHNVDVVIAGGMGMRAQELFAGQGIKVEVGAPPIEVERVLDEYLVGTLATGENACDH
jgi:predicted Fe-Mo cluster-binding NifX family protein